jgi:hypothetical protein
MKLRTNFDIYLKDQFKDASFSERFKRAVKAYGMFQTQHTEANAGLSEAIGVKA